MKKLLVLFSLLTAGAAHAQSKGTVLLDCNINAWPYQQFRVVQTFDGRMALDQLTTHGHWITSPLSHLEWERGSFQLDKDSVGNQLVVTRTNEGWFYRSAGAAGYADCSK